MEPTDFEYFLKEKIAKESSAYESEMEHAKPYVWDAIQQNLLEQKKSFTWKHLSAAVIFFLVISSLTFYDLSKRHSEELKNLSLQIIELNKAYSENFNQLALQNEELRCISQEDAIENKSTSYSITDINEANEQQTKIIYIRDTVIINQVKYITESIVADSLSQQVVNNEKNDSLKDGKLNLNIYPTYNTKKTSKEDAETFKIKINSFASNQ